jgi:hypothetical protein
MHAFIDAAKSLRADGYDMIVPVELDGAEWMELAASDPTGNKEFPSMKEIADNADAVVVLPEWETSKGARLEVFVAMNLNYPVFFYQEDRTLKQLNYDRILTDIAEGILI